MNEFAIDPDIVARFDEGVETYDDRCVILGALKRLSPITDPWSRDVTHKSGVAVYGFRIYRGEL